MPFRSLMKDRLTLVKKDGTIVKSEIQATVSSNGITRGRFRRSRRDFRSWHVPLPSFFHISIDPRALRIGSRSLQLGAPSRMCRASVWRGANHRLEYRRLYMPAH
jgi:hypothetical protein